MEYLDIAGAAFTAFLTIQQNGGPEGYRMLHTAAVDQIVAPLYRWAKRLEKN